MLPVYHAHQQTPPPEPRTLLEHSIRADLCTYLSSTDLTPLVELVLSSMRPTFESTLPRGTSYLGARRSPLCAHSVSVMPPLEREIPCAKIWVWHIANGTVLILQYRSDCDLLLLANNISAAAERALGHPTSEPFQHIYRALLQPDPRQRMTVTQAKQDWQTLLRHMEQGERASNPLGGPDPARLFSPASDSENSLNDIYLPPGEQPPPLEQSRPRHNSSCCTCS
jgi:hypothetical protein